MRKPQIRLLKVKKHFLYVALTLWEQQVALIPLATRPVTMIPLTAENIPLRGELGLGNGLGEGGRDQIVLISKYQLKPTTPKTRNPNAAETKGYTKVERHEPLLERFKLKTTKMDWSHIEKLELKINK